MSTISLVKGIKAHSKGNLFTIEAQGDTAQGRKMLMMHTNGAEGKHSRSNHNVVTFGAFSSHTLPQPM